MKAGSGEHFEQSYNAQAAVDIDEMLIVGPLLTNDPNDKEQLNPVVESISKDVMDPENVLVDTGYYSAKAVQKLEADSGPTVYSAIEKTGHHRTVSDLEKKSDPEKPADDAGMKEVMRYRLNTEEGKALYKQRKQTVEPVFGIIKEVLGFRRFSLRGKQKAAGEWCLVCLSYNLKRLFTLHGGLCPDKARKAEKRARNE